MKDGLMVMRAAKTRGSGVQNIASLSAKLFALGALLFLAACARPVGDFGRAQSDVLHDEVLPRAGALVANKHREEPVSLFNLTNEEKDMRNRVWRFLVASHAHDWMFDSAVELQRNRLIEPLDLTFHTDRYYRHLRLEQFASSRGRYLRLAQDAQNDVKTLPPTFASICKVMEIERRRQIAIKGLYAGNGAVKHQVYAREYENKNVINWFARAVDYRYQSYDIALNRLLVETPHEEAHVVNERLNRLAALVGRAKNGEFCDPFAEEAYNHDKKFPMLQSRYATQMEKPTDDTYLK